MRDIKLRDAGPHFIETIDAISSRNVTAGVTSAWIAGLPRNLIEPIAFAGTIIWAMAALSSGHLEQVLPTLGVMAMAGYRLLPNLQTLYNNLHLVATNRFSLDELAEELDFSSPSYPVQLPEKGAAKILADKSPLFSECIELRDITFVYSGAERPTLQGVSLRIGKGESIGFVGQTGSGKSTLINLLLGLYVPTSGEILADGNPWETVLRNVTRESAMCPRDFSWTTRCPRILPFGMPATKSTVSASKRRSSPRSLRR
jgi:ABC-type multidrug transport system fused ATPase/permease subunit